MSLNFSPAHHQSVEDDSRERRSKAPSRGPSKRPPGAPSNSPERSQTVESLRLGCRQSGRQDLSQDLRQDLRQGLRQSGRQSDQPPSNPPSRLPSKRPSGGGPLKNAFEMLKCWADPVPGSKKNGGAAWWPRTWAQQDARWRSAGQMPTEGLDEQKQNTTAPGVPA